MTIDKNRMTESLRNEKYPRSAAYDPSWVVSGWMGPNVLWLTEWLAGAMELQPGMRVLDMGCGKGRSSVFLAREFGVQVWANDLWIPATENLAVIREAGLEDRVFPIHAEAHELPYAEGFFDAIVSLDSYQYYGTDDLYLEYILKFLKPGGQLGIVVPGLVQDFPDNRVPEHLTRIRDNGTTFWVPECWCFHTAAWWRNHWDKTGLLAMETAEHNPDAWQEWAQFEHACEEAGTLIFPSEEPSLREDAGKHLTLVRVSARRREA